MRNRQRHPAGNKRGNGGNPGLAGGNIAQAVSGAAAPYLAEQIHKLTTDANGKVNTQANLMKIVRPTQKVKFLLLRSTLKY